MASCTVGVQLAASVVKALRIRISDEADVYIHYSMQGLKDAHASYHASGEQHIKKNRKHVEWNGGSTGQFEPMRIYRARPDQVITRVDCGGTIGWEVVKLCVLPILTRRPDMMVDARYLPHDSIVAFIVEVVGQWVNPRRSVSGYPILQTYRFGHPVQVEVNAFEVSGTTGVAQLEPF